MFTQPVASSTPTGSGNLAVSPVTANPASSTPSSRSSRLRGLSYLRSYTQTHLLSRDHGSHGTPQPTTSAPSPSTATTNPWFGAARNDRESSAAPASDNHGNPSSSSRTNRLSQLVPTLAHPLGLSTSFSGGRAHSGPTAGTASGSQSSDSSAFPFSNPDAPDRIADTARAAPPTDNMARARSATTGDAVGRHDGGGNSLDTLPSIRFSTFYDPRATRPSLKFAPISRTLPTGREVIRVGRYSERDNQPNVPANAPSAAPVGFKSKVVSRRHCEFWYEDGKWYIKDVKSSSGTFLNHIRLSPPGTESKPYPVNDGDIVQLGIDFKGGEEMIFRCVKMRLELNRGWQNKLNNFNMATHKRLRNMTAGSASNSSGSYSQDCSICLNSIAPCQSLFVAPCSHTWHYKCIRSLLSAPSYPIFICPNCRAAADLEAEVEDPEEWEQLDSDEGAAPQEGALLQPPPTDPNNPGSAAPSSAPRKSRESARSARFTQPPPPNEVPEVDMLLEPEPAQQASFPPQLSGTATTIPDPSILSHTMSDPMPIPAQRNILPGDGRRETRTPSPTGAPVTNGHEGPITPRNDAGPWVFDGSADNNTSHPSRLSSLESAVQAAGVRLQRDGDIS
ncbi:hypothetical protein C8A03DRAFT_40726 [Achaetomium macrosporum]|uniref:RING-type E3 ubiquitin transferase n=1 Tax=Achaetomium macrosporum TaxID=79813 RepID=A0AAN7H9V4_9PEZI|nr:hypothetical protein C8A03DRAFT_40726 [Achaetomium macrosporum]